MYDHPPERADPAEPPPSRGMPLGRPEREGTFAPASSAAYEAVRLVVGAAIVDDLERPTRLLSARRTEPEALAGGWELPGGKVDEGESPLAALHREVLEELGVDIRVGPLLPGPLPGATWPLGERFEMIVWLAEVVDGQPEPIEDHDELRWLGLRDLDAVAWLPADVPIVEALERLLT